MKFAALIAVASAVRVSQKTTSSASDAHDDLAGHLIKACDSSKDGFVTKKEVKACFKKHMPQVDADRIDAEVDQVFPMVDNNGDGKVSKDELAAAMRHGGPGSLAQEGPHSDDDHSDHDGPTPADVIEECDANENGSLSKKEVKDCIREHVPEEHQAEAEAMVDEMWPMVDKDGSGEVDEHELSEAMRGPKGKKGGKPPKAKELAKLLSKKGPSAKDVIEACDADKSGGIDIDEAHACIDAHISDEEKNAQAHEMVDAGFDEVDKNGDGEVDRKELKAAMKAHK